MAFLAPTAKTFREFLEQQNPFVFFVTIYVSAGLIANDRRANALQVYLSKPLTRLEHVAGKAAALMAFPPGDTGARLAPARAGAPRGQLRVRAEEPVPLSCDHGVRAAAGMATFTMLALSSLSKSSRFVAVMYAGVILFTSAIQGMFWAMTRSSAASLISPTASLNRWAT